MTETKSAETSSGRTSELRGVRIAGWTGLFFAILQSGCTLFMILGGLRAVIGVTALTSAVVGPLSFFHQDAVRIPIEILGGLGAAVNLIVLTRVWRLRARASGAWRRRTISPRERRSEQLQLVISVITLVLIAVEAVTHPIRVHEQAVRAHQTASAAVTTLPTPGGAKSETGR